MTARDAILGGLRAALAGAGEAPDIPRAYRRAWDAPRGEILDRFASRLRDYGVTVLPAGAESDIAALAERQLAARGIATLIVPPDLPATWRPAHPVPLEEAGQEARALNTIAGVMTGCAVAIAETGSIVLDAGAAQGRRALTLLPDYYLCVVRAGQIVGLVPEAVARLRPSVAEGWPLTFISGPSATADIELDRVAGVHGPRTLDVILVGRE